MTDSRKLVAGGEACPIPHKETVTMENVFSPLAGLPEHLPGKDRASLKYEKHRRSPDSARNSPAGSEVQVTLKKSKPTLSSPDTRVWMYR